MSGKELGPFDLDDVEDPPDPPPPDESFVFFRLVLFGISGNSCEEDDWLLQLHEDDSLLRLEFFWCRFPWSPSRPGDSIERFDERWRLECFAVVPFGEPAGDESLPFDCLRLCFFCFSLPSGGNSRFPAPKNDIKHWWYWNLWNVNGKNKICFFFFFSDRKKGTNLWP